MIAVAGVFLLGFVAFGTASYTTLRSVKVGSPMFEQYTTFKALVDDSTPSDGSLQPATVDYFRMFASRTPEDLQANVAGFHETVKSFREKKDFYKPWLPDGQVGELLAQGYTYADTFFDLVDTQIISPTAGSRKERGGAQTRAGESSSVDRRR